VNIAGYTRFDATSKKDLTDQFDRVYNTLVDHGIPVIIGEYALLAYDHNRPGIIERGEQRKYFEFLGNYARERRLTTMLWDAGQFLNRNTLQWRDAELFGQIRSSWTNRSGTASSDLVFLPKSSPITGRTLTLDTNGTDFQGVRHGSRNLAAGRDYTVSGNQLTLTATALNELAGDRSYGVNATREARFSRGVPWRIDVITYDPPVLSNTSGNTSGLTIPTRFRGDMLATMEATYDDGTNAGPASWTSYQQWDTAFTAYTGDSIKLIAEFLDSLKDSSRATLTFHFWSGATATYRHQVRQHGDRNERLIPHAVDQARRQSASTRLARSAPGRTAGHPNRTPPAKAARS